MSANKRTSPRRFRRRGTIMIMVVALLVLLMLIGTAWITTVSNDRGASQRHIVNSRADNLISGLAQMVEAKAGIADLLGFPVDLQDPAASNRDNLFFRPRSDTMAFNPDGSSADVNYPPALRPRVFSNTSWTCPIPDYSEPDFLRNERKDYLASRAPFAFYNGATLERVIWPAISGPLVGVPSVDEPLTPRAAMTPPGIPSTFEFESPWRDPSIPSDKSTRYTQRLGVQPTSITLTVNGEPKAFPAI
jgi:hypothetical protein